MAESKLIIPIVLPNRTVELTLFGETFGETLFEKDDAIENGEAPFQIQEGCFYEYKITNGFSLDTSEIVSQSKVNNSSGRISPNIYVGTLNIDVLDSDKNKCGEVQLEVQSKKASYREDYRHMLEEITEKCTDLLLQHSSPVSQYFEADFNAAASTWYQRFAFVKSILESVEFGDAVHKIISSPVTKWKESEIIKDIRGVKRFNNAAVRQLTSAGNRIDLPKEHLLKSIIQSIPSKIKVSNKTETVDTPENRFIKHALVTFQSFCSDFKIKLNGESRIKNEAGLLVEKLEHFLSHSVFKEIGMPTTLSLNSPVLQRKEGYREVLRVWLMFDLAAKMIWHGGEDVYSGNKRDVAVLYEYWLFFKLLDIIKEVFKIDSLAPEKLLEQTADGLGLKLKQGKFLPIEGVYISDTRKLRIEFSYNKTFSGDSEYPDGGSWSRNLRPDYTLSVWPYGIEQKQAEREELIVHIHFDAKYKVDNLETIFGKDDSLDEERKEQKKGTYKRADILKMHTYRDAIRRTAGAYVIYPGTVSDNKNGFHELLPGLGAFAIRPSKSNNGTEELKKFLNQVITHFMNRASQREKIALQTYEIYRDKNANELNEALPEAYGANRKLLPDETFVLIGYSTSPERFKWYEKNGKYIFRMDESKGSLELNNEVVNAKYLLLRKNGKEEASDLFMIKSKGPKVYSNMQLKQLNYPPSKNPKEYYLAIEIEEVKDNEFKNVSWKFKELEKYKSIINNERNVYSKAGLPFTVSLTDLMQVLKK